MRAEVQRHEKCSVLRRFSFIEVLDSIVYLAAEMDLRTNAPNNPRFVIFVAPIRFFLRPNPAFRRSGKSPFYKGDFPIRQIFSGYIDGVLALDVLNAVLTDGTRLPVRLTGDPGGNHCLDRPQNSVFKKNAICVLYVMLHHRLAA